MSSEHRHVAQARCIGTGHWAWRMVMVNGMVNGNREQELAWQTGTGLVIGHGTQEQKCKMVIKNEKRPSKCKMAIKKAI